MTVHDLFPFRSSIAIGLLIGLERERSHPADVHQTAEPRTFALLALAGTLAASIGTWVVVAGLCAAAALLVIGYLGTSRRDPGATTEVAALSTFLLGALAWHQTGLAAALGITLLVLLMSKSPEIGTSTRSFRARTAKGDERETIWTKQKKDYPGLRGLRRKDLARNPSRRPRPSLTQRTGLRFNELSCCRER